MGGSCGMYGGEERCRCILHYKTEYLENFMSPELMQIIIDQTMNKKTVQDSCLLGCCAMS
jgi:hypothetical protein